MKKGLILGFIFLIFSVLLPSVYAKSQKDGIKVSNKYFSFTLPYEAKGTFIAVKKDKEIFIYEKASKKAGYGGFAFGIKAFKNPADHAMMPNGLKIGELTDKKGIIYDMVLIRPTDVQFDYTKGGGVKEYNLLYNFAEKAEPQGVCGSVYNKNQGMKGEDLYKDILKKHVTAIKEKWDSTKLEKEGMSYMYNVLSKTNENVLDKIGFIYYDSNGDGIDELFIGEITKGDWKGVIYDIYTMVDRKPAHVISGGTRNRYFACDDSFLCYDYSSGAKESGTLVYTLEENSIQLFPQVGFKYDAYENEKKPWFVSYNFWENKWENVTEQTFRERKSVFERYKRFDFVPLRKLDWIFD